MPVRWSSTHTMLKACLKYKMPISTWCQKSNFDAELSVSNWDHLSTLCNFLASFAKISDFCQGEKYPTIYTSIIHFNKIFDVIEDLAEKKVFSASCHAARLKLKKYYKLTDLCSAHYVSVVLNPTTKMRYFAVQGWEDNELQAIKKLLFFY